MKLETQFNKALQISGVSKAELARKMGLSPQRLNHTLQKEQKGELRLIPLDFTESFCNALGLNLKDVIKE